VSHDHDLILFFIRPFPYTIFLPYGPAPKKIGNPQCTVFDLMTLQEATEHFSEQNKVGEGGFGTVYKVYTPIIEREDST
jgi:hypothetical protein